MKLVTGVESVLHAPVLRNLEAKRLADIAAEVRDHILFVYYSCIALL